MLENIVSLSEIRADELMRPRVQLRTFRPPVDLADLRAAPAASGYLLVIEPESEELAAAIVLRQLTDVPGEHLERYAEPVVYVPWCTTVAPCPGNDAAAATAGGGGGQRARRDDRHSDAVDDILDTIFSRAPSRSERLLRRLPIRRSRRACGKSPA